MNHAIFNNVLPPEGFPHRVAFAPRTNMTVGMDACCRCRRALPDHQTVEAFAEWHRSASRFRRLRTGHSASSPTLCAVENSAEALLKRRLQKGPYERGKAPLCPREIGCRNSRCKEIEH